MTTASLAGHSRATVWVAVCGDNITGAASSRAEADRLYRCGHGQDSFCCYLQPCEVDAVPVSPPPPPRHRPPVFEDPLPLDALAGRRPGRTAR
jgi:hypothetical protein